MWRCRQAHREQRRRGRLHLLGLTLTRSPTQRLSSHSSTPAWEAHPPGDRETHPLAGDRRLTVLTESLPGTGPWARPTCCRDAALQRGDEGMQQQGPGQAGPVLGQQLDGPDGHAPAPPCQRLWDVQQLQDLQGQRRKRKHSHRDGLDRDRRASSPGDTRWCSRSLLRPPAGGRSPGPRPAPHTSSRQAPLDRSERLIGGQPSHSRGHTWEATPAVPPTCPLTQDG